jgi:hypothetical protein
VVIVNAINRIIMWFKFRNHPCYIGKGEFDHTLEAINDSFDHDLGCETIEYLQCEVCGATHDEDSSIPEDINDYFSQ